MLSYKYDFDLVSSRFRVYSIHESHITDAQEVISAHTLYSNIVAVGQLGG